MKTKFQLGKSYSRREISKTLGGSQQGYLPHTNNQVVCGCFRKDLNPGAPAEVLPANTDDKKRWAETFHEQKEAVPIFLKERVNYWKYSGLWRCNSIVRDSDVIAQRAKQARRTGVAMVLRLRKVRD
jgi:hypothetical protein